MKIALIIGSLTGGGAERVVSELANSFVENGNSVSIILVANYKISYRIHEDVRVVDATCPNAKPGTGTITRIKKLHNLLKQETFDVILSFTTKVNNIVSIAHLGVNSKLVLCERNDPRFDPVERSERILRAILYPKASGFVFQTEGERAFFSARIQKRSVVIPNPINPELPAVFKGTRSKRIVTATRLTMQKNLEMAIDGFKILASVHPEFIFEIYGKGELEVPLKEYVQELGLASHVIFKGQSNNLYNEIADASCFVLTSNYEGISNAMLEAMALGIPTISTDYPSGGARESIENYKNGIIIPLNDSQTLGNELISLIENSELQEKLSINGEKIRDKYSLSKINRMWIDFIKNL